MACDERRLGPLCSLPYAEIGGDDVVAVESRHGGLIADNVRRIRVHPKRPSQGRDARPRRSRGSDRGSPLQCGRGAGIFAEGRLPGPARRLSGASRTLRLQCTIFPVRRSSSEVAAVVRGGTGLRHHPEWQPGTDLNRSSRVRRNGESDGCSDTTSPGAGRCVWGPRRSEHPRESRVCGFRRNWVCAAARRSACRAGRNAGVLDASSYAWGCLCALCRQEPRRRRPTCAECCLRVRPKQGSWRNGHQGRTRPRADHGPVRSSTGVLAYGSSWRGLLPSWWGRPALHR